MPSTREMSKKTSFDASDFIKGFKAALQEQTVIEMLKAAIAQPVSEQISELKELLDVKDRKINDLTKQVQDLESRCDELEQYSRRNSLRIYGIPEQSDEHLTEQMTNLVNEELAIQPQLNISDICRVHRVGRQNSNADHQKPRPILLKLATHQCKERIYKNRFALKRSSKNIFINEDLTKKRAELARKARLLRRDGKIKDTWTYDGNVMMKCLNGKTFPVKCTASLDEISERSQAT